ncbi:hypothetical protein E2C01_039873 [Portunus trituberculatus]|uniref:Uncharacterized protein n=1 Tax=Portunus trituberculatus TaxID=210409 RepID=A0A5B7FP77_PORTR|nr:hypothetical protein [Portunus trituberculatus]
MICEYGYVCPPFHLPSCFCVLPSLARHTTNANAFYSSPGRLHTRPHTRYLPASVSTTPAEEFLPLLPPSDTWTVLPRMTRYKLRPQYFPPLRTRIRCLGIVTSRDKTPTRLRIRSLERREARERQEAGWSEALSDIGPSTRDTLGSPHATVFQEQHEMKTAEEIAFLSVNPAIIKPRGQQILTGRGEGLAEERI